MRLTYTHGWKKVLLFMFVVLKQWVGPSSRH
uniref:Uncharacterized protein n=1 Tax=mine drainage metagenome TaxID=410659 RepID=E6QJ62_9ZZZZ